jgi:hypothetical protein
MTGGRPVQGREVLVLNEKPSVENSQPRVQSLSEKNSSQYFCLK